MKIKVCVDVTQEKRNPISLENEKLLKEIEKELKKENKK